MRPSPVPASGNDVMAGTSTIVRISVWFSCRADEIVSKKVWEKSCSVVPSDTGSLPVTRKWENWTASFWNAQMCTLIRRPRHGMSTIMLNYDLARVRRVVPLSQRSVNQKAREHSQRSKTGGVCGKRRREVCSDETYEARGAVMAEHGILCSPTHQNRHFAVFHLSSFPACSRSQCLHE